MEVDPNYWVNFIDEHNTIYSFQMSQVELVDQEETSDGSAVLGNITKRLMTTNEDYIKTLKHLANIS